MKYIKLLLFTFIFVTSCFLLAACGNDTSYVNDQRGKPIPVTASDSNTYTFKLSARQMEKIETPSVEISEETIPEETIPEETEPAATAVESESMKEEVPKEPLATEGPKTGEP